MNAAAGLDHGGNRAVFVVEPGGTARQVCGVRYHVAPVRPLASHRRPGKVRRQVEPVADQAEPQARFVQHGPERIVEAGYRRRRAVAEMGHEGRAAVGRPVDRGRVGAAMPDRDPFARGSRALHEVESSRFLRGHVHEPHAVTAQLVQPGEAIPVRRTDPFRIVRPPPSLPGGDVDALVKEPPEQGGQVRVGREPLVKTRRRLAQLVVRIRDQRRQAPPHAVAAQERRNVAEGPDPVPADPAVLEAKGPVMLQIHQDRKQLRQGGIAGRRRHPGDATVLDADGYAGIVGQRSRVHLWLGSRSHPPSNTSSMASSNTSIDSRSASSAIVRGGAILRHSPPIPTGANMSSPFR